MACPFTGEDGHGVRDIGGGVTVYPQMKLVACEGTAVVACSESMWQIKRYRHIMKRAINRGAVYFKVDTHFQLAVIVFEYGPKGFSFCVTPFAPSGLLNIRCVRVAQRCAKRWLARREFTRKLEAVVMAFHARLGEHSPLRQIPVDLFAASIACR